MVGGSDMAQNVLVGYKYKEIFKTTTHLKIYAPLRFISVLKGKLTKRISKTLYQYRPFNAPVLKFKGAQVSLNKIARPADITRSGVPVFQNVPSTAHLSWLVSCPEVESHLFVLEQDNKPVGHVVLYTSLNKKHKTGSIIHVPYLGTDEKLWSAAIFEIEKYLKAQGCVSIAALASDATFNKVLKSHNFVRSLYQKPYFLRDLQNKLEESTIASLAHLFFRGRQGIQVCVKHCACLVNCIGKAGTHSLSHYARS
ncbi:MAG: hypothetical protein HC896_16975 [Bacteroidales bacterium]|nr:hypothetical protein [Bacteroidales bacterium]